MSKAKDILKCQFLIGNVRLLDLQKQAQVIVTCQFLIGNVRQKEDI